ncbi:G protein-coupled receptor 137Ba-like [Tubulanus polymorphus]|uniref:G protein-coupled receptor 137Ba-like n=1 Tax=Tubulanus polymorphus TaxID=672921 RepID=UPI003DA67855
MDGVELSNINGEDNETRDATEMPVIFASPPATIGPPIPIPPSVHLGLTIAFTILYSFLFFMVYIQLWMILYYKHKRFSYQTIFLALCLVWAGLRTTLFSFYYKNCVLANNLAMFPNWWLYSLPVCLQFITLCLLVLYFSQVLHKARTAYREQQKSRFVPIITSIAIIIFIVTNIICAVLTYIRKHHINDNVRIIVQCRVIINDLLFVLFGIYLAICIVRVTRTQSANLVLQARGTTSCLSITVCVLIIVLYMTRAIYNIIAVTCPKIPGFGYSWINVSDQAELIDLDQGIAYVSFGAVLFIWEFLPTFLVVMYFRVQIPKNNVTVSDVSSHSHGSRAYFFDNPRRYDSDDDLSSRSHVSPPRGGLYDVSSSPHYLINAPNSYRPSWHASPQSAPNRQNTSASGLLSSNSFPSGQYGIQDSTPPILFTSAQNPRQVKQSFYDDT